MKAAVCEDEKDFAQRLSALAKELLREHSPETELFSDGRELLEAVLSGEKFDLMFIDLNLENSDGMEIAARIRDVDKAVPIVFVTGIEDRAAEGYSVAAFDYIFKGELENKLPAVMERLCGEYFRKPLAVTGTDNITRTLSPSELLFVESDGRGTLWHTSEEKIKSSVPINKAASMLPQDGFVQIYRSVYVNISGIKRLSGDTAELSDGTVLPLSRRRRRETVAALMRSMRNI